MKKVKTGVKIGDIMNRDFISINSNASLREAAKKMVSNAVGSLVVKDGEKLKGLLIEKNIIEAIAGNNKDWSKKVKEIIKKKIATIRPSADIYEALEKMAKNNARWLPIVKKEKVIGLITLRDIIKIEPGLFELVAHKFY